MDWEGFGGNHGVVAWSSPVPVSSFRQTLIREILEAFHLLGRRILLVLDDQRYSEKAFPNKHVRWRGLGLHEPLHSGTFSQPDFTAPPFVQRQLVPRRYTNLIWVSGDVTIQSCDVEFVWTVAHEFRHAEQGRPLNFGTVEFTTALRRIRGQKPVYRADLPAEIDAEITAWRVARSMFGCEKIDARVFAMAKAESCNGIYKQLWNLGPIADYDPYEETARAIERLQHELVPFGDQDDSVRFPDPADVRRWGSHFPRGSWAT